MSGLSTELHTSYATEACWATPVYDRGYDSTQLRDRETTLWIFFVGQLGFPITLLDLALLSHKDGSHTAGYVWYEPVGFKEFKLLFWGFWHQIRTERNRSRSTIYLDTKSQVSSCCSWTCATRWQRADHREIRGAAVELQPETDPRTCNCRLG